MSTTTVSAARSSSSLSLDSTNLPTSRYVQGGLTEKSSWALEWWEKKQIKQDSTDIGYTVEKYYEGRLDKIATTFYNEPRYWWIIAQLNTILDPIAEIVEGKYLLIPTLDRIRTEILTGSTGGTPSTRVTPTSITPIS